jgi:hypothetical protein
MISLAKYTTTLEQILSVCCRHRTLELESKEKSHEYIYIFFIFFTYSDCRYFGTGERYFNYCSREKVARDNEANGVVSPL